MPNELPASSEVGEDYNALFDHLRKERYYGEITFQVRNGEVVKVTFNETYVNVSKALAARLGTPDEVEPRGEEQHGRKAETYLCRSSRRT